MIRKSGNRFAEKIMPQNGTGMIRKSYIGRAYRLSRGGAGGAIVAAP